MSVVQSMSIDALYAEFANVPKANVMASCSALLKQVGQIKYNEARPGALR